MSHLTAMLERMHFPSLRLRRAGLLLPTALLPVAILGFIFYASPPAYSESAPTSLELPMAAEARLTEPTLPFYAVAPRLSASGGGDPFELSWSSLETDYTTAVAWGDYDGDGDLDLATANCEGSVSVCRSVRLYRNDDGELTTQAVWSSPASGNLEEDITQSVAWGDYDGDGNLDLAVGGYSNRLYRNGGVVAGVPQMTLVWTSQDAGNGWSVAWGDVDGDGDPDLMVGYNGGPNRLYCNDGGMLTTGAVYTTTESDQTLSVAWGDFDGDGDLDMIAGDYGAPSRLYRNDGGMLTTSAIYSFPYLGIEQDRSVVWGDVDGDGDLDLARGKNGRPNQIYRNDGVVGGVPQLTLVWTAPITDSTYSVAWGDYDSDGDLDLAVGNKGQPNRLYCNDGVVGGIPQMTLVWSSPIADETTSVAWGDVDGDGDLDLAVGNSGYLEGAPNRVYLNNGGGLQHKTGWSSTETGWVTAAAWGDVDGDGDLDLAVGSHCYNDPACRSVQLHSNENGLLSASAVYSTAEADYTESIAWGDYDGDGDLDLAVGNQGQPSRLYRNDGGTLTDSAVWSSDLTDFTGSIAWGDIDGDGDLDLAVGNYGQPNRLYRNDGVVAGIPQMTPVWSAGIADSTGSIAWGDYDGDGDLDLAVGNAGQPNRLYRNEGGMLTANPAWSSVITDVTENIAWGDYDGDGNLDLAVGNWGYPNRLYRNDGGMLTASPVWSSVEADYTTSMAWGDADGDGDLDLTVGSGHWSVQQPIRLYRNDEGMLTASAVWSSAEVSRTPTLAWGDVDGDGDLDLAAGTLDYPNRLYLNGRDERTLPGSVPVVCVARPGPNADFFSTRKVWPGSIPITYTLSDPQGDPVKSIRAWYSPDGGGRWLPAVATSNTVTTSLATTATYAYNWDVLASGFFGQSDNVVFRIAAIPAIVNKPNQTPGPYFYGAYASQTFPFRVRGTQVRVISGTQPVPNVIVYRLPAGQTSGATLFADATGRPFRTDGQGYLQGRGQLGIGDELVALFPISATSSYTLYHTSATPIPTGLSMYTVNVAGVQTLTVTSTNPLILFNLDVSLEWDARQDTAYLNQLEFNLQRASEVLYDITNGQAALGNMNVFHDRGQWNYVHVRVYADNQLRPYASQGGVTTVPISDPLTSTVIYLPGQVSMGATWNRYGNAGVTLGEDWPRTLAHELGHYLLYQDDDYLGLNANGLLVPATTCTNTIMADAYRDDYSELRPPSNWLPDCANTLSNKSTGRSDWATVEAFYPALHITDNAGPIGLPLAVTQVKFVGPVTPTMTLPDPRFYLTQNGARVQPGGHAQGYLFRGDGLVNLGRPVVDQLLARGAQPGDRVCVLEPDANRLGCKVVVPDDNQQLALYAVSGWQPDVRITPVSSQTVNVQVFNLSPGLSVHARLYASTGLASPPQALVGNTYSTTFNLGDAVFEGSVDVWVEEGEPRREIVAHYALGGDPANARGGFANARGGFANARGGFANARGGFAPVLSGDGQVILYSANLDFPPGEFYTLQAATLIPDPPTWATVVGKGYRLLRSAGAPDLVGPSISMGYAQNEAPSGGETFLRVFVMTGTTWVALPTTLDVDNNLAVAPAQGPGLYVLMSTIEIPLYGPGWDAFSYPVQVTRTVEQALQSIAGKYSMVYWYDGSDKGDPWKVYAVNLGAWARPWVNDLNELHFGESYWISLTQVITLQLNGGTASALTVYGKPEGTVRTSGFDGNIQSPPATFYGLVLGGFNFTPAPGTTVTAWINGKPCGQGKTLQVNGETVYTLNVFADGPGGGAGCGAPGRVVTFKIEDRSMSPVVAWDNNELREVPLSGVHRVYLPVILKNR